MGGNIPGGNFLGGNFPTGEGHLPGGKLIGGSFPGGSFSDTNWGKLLTDYEQLSYYFVNLCFFSKKLIHVKDALKAYFF